MIEKGQVQDVEYSGGTYQIKVVDEENPHGAWVFLQFGAQEKLQDVICSCDLFTDEHTCPHTTAAYLYLFQDKKHPLHIRLANSFWHHLFLALADLWGDEPSALVAKEGFYATQGDQNTQGHTRIIPKTTEIDLFLAQLIYKREEETEETSIKFSNLPQEEIDRWKEGRPSFGLLYELSFWSDMAKWFLQKQEQGEEYLITWLGSGLPGRFTCEWKDLTLEVTLSKELWLSLIPALNTIESSLQTFSLGEQSCFVYQPEEKKLYNKTQTTKGKEAGKEGISLGEWLFFPEEGFYPKLSDVLCQHFPLEGMALARFLEENSALLADQLKPYHIYEHMSYPHYHLAFDAEWNLVITTYLFEPFDLTTKTSTLFGHWAFVDQDGFYRVATPLFPEARYIVPHDEMNAFIREQKAFLHTQPGFHTHVAQLEGELFIQVDEKGCLSFHHRIELEEREEKTHDFGQWVYFEGLGFYETKNPLQKTSIFPGLTLQKAEIAPFVEKHWKDLEHIEGFFAKDPPLQKFGVHLSFTEEKDLLVQPSYVFREGVKPEDLLFLDGLVYEKNQGFSIPPMHPNFPLDYIEEQEVAKEELDRFLQEDLPLLAPSLLSLPKELERPRSIRPTLVLIKKAPKRPAHYLVELVYATEFGQVTAQELWRQLKSKKQFWASPAGCLHLAAYNFEALEQLEASSVQEPYMLLSAWDLIKWSLLEDPKPPKEPKSLQLYQKLLEEPVKRPMKTPGLKATLRPYQELGVSWLWHLWQLGLSGLLSDDMGLGKTLQAIALIAAIRKDQRQKLPILIVCPTSVLYHWKEKVLQFYPKALVYTHWGLQRDLGDFTKEHTIFLTSYGTLRSDIEEIKKLTFSLVVFDELQVAKNHTSLLYQALQKIRSSMRLGLTGTPIENSLRELKAIFDLLLPGYMPKDKLFKNSYLRPIEKEGDEVKKERLRRLIHPFLLRRKKEEVLDDLPDKVEQVAHADLLGEQKELYTSLLLKEREAIVEEIAKEHPSYIHIFSILTQLKMICNHPACYLKNPKEWQKFSSGKFDLCKELIGEALGSSQKIVIFSQYLHMLDIFGLYLNAQGIGFAEVRGSTKQRELQIQRFQKDPSCLVFLGSLQAAGVGIELTEASVVIHYDRWWNKAKEDQATDRVHRLGQKKGVQVFKLVTMHTIEERIDQLIEKKGRLLEEVVGRDDPSLFKAFTKQELLSLFQLDEER